MSIETDVALRKTLPELAAMRDRAVSLVEHGLRAIDDAEQTG